MEPPVTVRLPRNRKALTSSVERPFARTARALLIARPMTRIFAVVPIFAFALACGEPSPVIVGRVQSGLTATNTLGVEVNGNLHTVTVEEDGRFSIQDLPTGDLVLAFESTNITGEITIHEVQPGELVEIEVDAGPGHLEISVLRRDPLVVIDELPEHRGDLVISGNHMIHHFSPGAYEGDLIIKGNDITLVGPNHGCDDAAVIYGDLLVEGNHINLIHVTVAGSKDIRGNDVRIYGGCSASELDLDDYEDDDSDSDDYDSYDEDWNVTISYEGG